ncbi:fungal-specific transcription factor domain-containing protein [Fusarium solani]|uniref:Fungal-specific transcription factor domain-containing protein n=1 Tax=Fusarium solani TaxID=169388 RepID=A0A9P9K4I4_FUSSL|nr:fungal-specific transcription factor domain-containing protein [Fusarium solani]KAH7243941.1 fungal-specific transcription factor domain-containing protein [Fusarium solani]
MEPIGPGDISQSEFKASRPRLKAPWACLRCRERKVRCDVSKEDGPCTNCCLRGKTCTTLPSTKRAGFKDRVRLLKKSVWGHSPHADEITSDAETSPHALNPPTPTSFEPSFCVEPGADSVLYLDYHFLSIGNLANMPSEEINFLDIQGCLLVPRRQTMDSIVQQYFLHVHPLLPLLDERSFWDVYSRRWAAADASDPKISLLVFQALLFAACNFVPLETLENLGFSSLREAKAGFYSKAKLLYDFGSESSSICIAQAALLLSFRSSSTYLGIKEVNITWLNIAIQHAQIAEAAWRAPSTASIETDNSGLQSVLKRLWWCCIIRDRVLSLCLRRRPQIDPAHTSSAFYAPLRSADLENEIQHSRVYCKTSKTCLNSILERFADLCVVLTDVLALVYPMDKQRLHGPDLAAILTRISDTKNSLREWDEKTSFSHLLRGRRTETLAVSNDTEVPHYSVTLHINLIYIYYHSSWIALCHYEALSLASQTSLPCYYIPSGWPAVSQNQWEIQDAALSVTQSLQALHHMNLDRWLPSSVVACIATPLVLHMLDVKLARLPISSGSATSNSELLEKNLRLKAVIQTIKTCYEQYDIADFVIRAVQHIAGFLELGCLQPTTTTGTSDSFGWPDIFSSNPNLYLRLVLSIDLSLSNGRFPEEEDFPVGLRRLFAWELDAAGSLFAHAGEIWNSSSPLDTDRAGMAFAWT